MSFPWWSLFLMVVGVLALGTLILNLFSAVGDRPGHAGGAERCPVGSEDFLLALAGVLNAPLQAGGTARLLNNGEEFFPAMLEAVGRAGRSINILVYIWRDGEISEAFFEKLLERARAGVEVRILVDGFGGMRAPKHRIRELRDAGGKWHEFHSPKFGRLTRLHRRTHRRAIVVDGRVGFTGGAAIADHWARTGVDEGYWRDCMVELHGPLAVSLQGAFAQLWTQTTGEFLVGEAFYPKHPPADDSGGEEITRHLSVISSPSGEAHPMRHLFWFSIQSARERVYVTNPYFVPDEILQAVIEERARAGVDVRFLVPGDRIDLKPIRWASHSYFDDLLKSGVRIYEYQPTLIHQKLLVADGVWSIVGSVNMDVRSKELNQENAIGMLDREFAATVEETFFQDLEHAREITLEDWRRRSPLARVRERFFRLFEEQL